jgi:hypothetical protein
VVVFSKFEGGRMMLLDLVNRTEIDLGVRRMSKLKNLPRNFKKCYNVDLQTYFRRKKKVYVKWRTWGLFWRNLTVAGL